MPFLHSFSTDAGKACNEAMPVDKVAQRAALEKCIGELGFADKIAALRGEKLTG